MTNITKDFCFCTLALGHRYRLLTQDLARDLETYSPGTFLVVGTDYPQDFKGCKNIIAYPQSQQGILHCYHDKRFPIEKALEQFQTAILIDADTRILGQVPQQATPYTGIQGFHENLVNHIQKYTPERLNPVKKIAAKLEIPLDQVDFVGEALLIVSRDGGKEKEFIKQWGRIGKYLELQKIYAGSGIVIGLAMVHVGWQAVESQDWQMLNKVTQHIDASHNRPKSSWNDLKRRVGYHYRLNKERLLALGEFDFYYR